MQHAMMMQMINVFQMIKMINVIKNIIDGKLSKNTQSIVKILAIMQLHLLAHLVSVREYTTIPDE